ncbi:methyl-accepting chemotaxis protein [Salinispira pacifica]|uniref:Methyl-accepting chemotaxis protein n=1 Tax=Salinispira pacifica TaxID=1307761 RepID=V5WF08_9SPIO|nr:methyl-accepting chemotaxis protein [Salinispira pacifica]AHC14220.1 Methyl-accepting chemotaxis protein [Salinispira pacifica]
MQRLSTRFFAILSGYILLFLATVILTLSITRQQADDGVLINMAGRQRMLTQRMTKELFHYLISGEDQWLESHRNTRNVFHASLTALRDGGQIPLDLSMERYRSIPGALTPEILSALEAGTEKWERYRQEADSVLQSRRENRSSEPSRVSQNTELPDTAALNSLSSLSVSLLGDMNAAVVLMQEGNERKVASLITGQFIILGFILVYSLLVLVYIRRGISNPLQEVTDTAAILGRGALAEIQAENTRSDEIGQLRSSFIKLSRMLDHRMQLLMEMGNGQLKQEIQAEGPDDRFARALVQTRDSLSDLIYQVRNATENSRSAAGELSESASTVASGASEQAASLEQISSNLNEIRTRSRENTRSADKVAEASRDARQLVEQNTQMNNELIRNMAELEQSASDIQSITKTIDDISFQINLLALNANVEAARAGKYGKGFSVVAEEVRNLAARSTDAVAETRDLISRNNELTGSVKAGIENGNSVLVKVAQSTGDIHSRLDEVRRVLQNQDSQISEITDGIDQISAVTQSNTASAEELSAAADELNSLSRRLSELVEVFSI